MVTSLLWPPFCSAKRPYIILYETPVNRSTPLKHPLATGHILKPQTVSLIILPHLYGHSNQLVPMLITYLLIEAKLLVLCVFFLFFWKTNFGHSDAHMKTGIAGAKLVKTKQNETKQNKTTQAWNAMDGNEPNQDKINKIIK